MISPRRPECASDNHREEVTRSKNCLTFLQDLAIVTLLLNNCPAPPMPPGIPRRIFPCVILGQSATSAKLLVIALAAMSLVPRHEGGRAGGPGTRRSASPPRSRSARRIRP